MQINVNGQDYDRWESVPAEARQQLAAMLPDADQSGVPDLFETGAMPPGAQTFTSSSIMVNGQTVSSSSDLSPELQAMLQQTLGRVAPMLGGTTVTASTAPGTPVPTPPGASPMQMTTPPPPLEPGQVMLNGVPTTVREATTVKKGWFRRLFGG